jgi:hypothetical protein
MRMTRAVAAALAGTLLGGTGCAQGTTLYTWPIWYLTRPPVRGAFDG